MKINRLNNLARNSVSAEILVFYRVFVPFILRTAILHFLGAGYLGLNGLFESVLQVLNLADLGVESAIVYSLYQPIAEDDHQTICALMALYKKYYFFIGILIGAAGLLLTPLIPRLIQGEIPDDLNIYVLYLMNLAFTSFSYLIAAYKKCLLKAHMRNDLISRMTLFVSIFTDALQLIMICFVKSYYLYLSVIIVNVVLRNATAAWCAGKLYPSYKPAGRLGKEQTRKFNRRIKDLFTVKISTVVQSSADTIVISAYLGLTTLAVYQNYYFILVSVLKFLDVLFESAMSGIGNSLITETEEKNYRDFKLMTFAILWIAGWFACCLLCLYQPFIRLWAGGEYLLPFSLVVLFVCYFLLTVLNKCITVYKDAAGIWHEDRFRPLAAALLNLTLNLLTVRRFGLYGILLSSIVAMLVIEIPWLIHNIFSMIFPRTGVRGYIGTLFLYLPVILAACAAALGVCGLVPFDGIPGLLLRAVICVFIPNLIFLAVYCRRPELRHWLEILKTLIRPRKKAADKDN